ncbi:hypothetical protein [Pelagicoccus albus]|uniref:Nucleotidyltransferase n=1 Tax=Pelagicoccus albus TaxID=415222 RepID=A0A7X1B4H0_9BACT|nr:hypothetical protein [Pelagicoccus albus]MBC2605483.1 hypothetical protein [Pelagicoccus albus]
MDGEPRPVEDFNEIFAAFEESEDPILLVGGHAVNVWALSYYYRSKAEIAPHEPLTSSDMDIYATRNALLWLGKKLGGDVRFAALREIVLGAMEIDVGGRPFLLEALRSVKGVTDEELTECKALVDVAGNEILVPLPHVLLKAKLSNALELDQGDRQDVKHVKLLAVVLREYLIDLLDTVKPEFEREVLGIIRGAVSVALSADAVRFGKAHWTVFVGFLPLERMASSVPKIASFAKVEFQKRFRS